MKLVSTLIDRLVLCFNKTRLVACKKYTEQKGAMKDTSPQGILGDMFFDHDRMGGKQIYPRKDQKQ